MNKNNATQFATPSSLESQEHLSMQRLAKMQPRITALLPDRPTANFIDLMNWSQDNFKQFLTKTDRLNKYVHNRIIIDGQFMQFCEENKISVECLYKDGIISWKTEQNFEKFFVQGAFIVKTKNVEFLHINFYHKGNANEDEISFFIICDDSQFEEYTKLRNEFDAWVSERDRGNLHIRVVEAEDIPYTKDLTWDDLFLPQDMKTEIKGMVENFLGSKDWYLNNRIPWKRGMLLFGPPGNGKSSLIKTIMSCYNFKPVTIVAGANDEMVREAFAYAEEQSPSLLYFEDLDSTLDRTIDTSSFLNLMDGVSTKNGLLVIATANNVKQLKKSVSDRPSRFDRKFEVPLPDADMAYKYMKKWFCNIITDKKCRELCKLVVKYGFSYAYIKEFYISSMFEALSGNRKVPTSKDIDNAMNRLIKDKNLLNGSSINMDRYFA